MVARMIQTPHIPPPGAWGDLAIQDRAFSQIGGLMQAIQDAKAQRAEESFLSELTDMLSYSGAQPEAGGEGPAGPSFSQAVSAAGQRERPGGISGFLDMFNPTTPGGGMTGLQRQLSLIPIQQELGWMDPKYQYGLSRQQTTDQYRAKAEERSAAGEDRAVKNQKVKDRIDAVIPPEVQKVRDQIYKMQKQLEWTTMTTGDQNEINYLNGEISRYQEILKSLEKGTVPVSPPATGSPGGFNDLGKYNAPGVTAPKGGRSYTMPQSWGAWFPKISPQGQAEIDRRIQGGENPAVIEAKLREKGIIP